MIMFAICPPYRTPDSGFSSPNCSYYCESPKRKITPSRRRINYCQDASTQTAFDVDPQLKKIAKDLARMCDDFDREFFSDETLRRIKEEEHQEPGVVEPWNWISSFLW